MGAKLSVIKDVHIPIADAHIFTPGQGICLEKLCVIFEKDTSPIVFQKVLAYGSWYDILIRINGVQDQEAYLLKGVYLSAHKSIQLSHILREENRIDGTGKPTWQCKNCTQWNEHGIRICLYCYTNYARNIIQGLSFIPGIGLPFSITHAILETGRAAHTKEIEDQVNAGVSISLAALDIVLTPLFVSSLIKIPAAAAAKTGTELTVKTVFQTTGQVAARMAFKEVVTAAERKAAARGIIETILQAPQMDRE